MKREISELEGLYQGSTSKLNECRLTESRLKEDLESLKLVLNRSEAEVSICREQMVSFRHFLGLFFMCFFLPRINIKITIRGCGKIMWT